MVSLSLTVVPEWANGVFTLGTQSSGGGWSRNQRGWDPSPLAASIVSLIWNWWRRCKLQGGGWGWMEIRQKQPPLYFPNLYPPLTPVPQCVVEIRAIGQSPIHCHPEYFKVKPRRLTKKVLLIKGSLSRLTLSSFRWRSLPRIFSPCPSLCRPAFCLHIQTRRSPQKSWRRVQRFVLMSVLVLRS